MHGKASAGCRRGRRGVRQESSAHAVRMLVAFGDPSAIRHVRRILERVNAENVAPSDNGNISCAIWKIKIRLMPDKKESTARGFASALIGSAVRDFGGEKT